MLNQCQAVEATDRYLFVLHFRMLTSVDEEQIAQQLLNVGLVEEVDFGEGSAYVLFDDRPEFCVLEVTMPPTLNPSVDASGQFNNVVYCYVPKDLRWLVGTVDCYPSNHLQKVRLLCFVRLWMSVRRPTSVSLLVRISCKCP
jgi:hypothetical protein